MLAIPTTTTADPDVFNKINSGFRKPLWPRVHAVPFTAAHGQFEMSSVDALAATMPASPADGETIGFVSADPSDTGIATVQLIFVGDNINGVAGDYTLAFSKGPALLVFNTDGAVGWTVQQSPVEPFTSDQRHLEWGGLQSLTFYGMPNVGYMVSASSKKALLPAAATAGDEIDLIALDHTITGTVVDPQGLKIAGSTSPVTIGAKGWAVTYRYSGATDGWIPDFRPTLYPGPRWDNTLKELRYYDGVRELSAPVGFAVTSYPPGQGPLNAAATSISLAASGGSCAIPIVVSAAKLVQSVSIRNLDTATLRTLEGRLYKDRLNNSNTIDEVPGCDFTDSFTPGGAASTRTVNVSTPGTLIPPGVYWLVLRNTSGAQTWALGSSVAGALGINLVQTKTLGSALGATLDLVAATWTKVTTLPVVSLNGRPFGTSAGF